MAIRCSFWGGLLSMALLTHAQWNCNDTAALLKIRENWHHGQDFLDDKSINAGAKRDLSKTIDKLYALLQEAYPAPLGCKPGWYRQFFNIKNRPYERMLYPFGVASFYSMYNCDKRKKGFYFVKETGTWAWIYSNRLNWFLSQSDTVKINGRQLYVRAGYKGELNGMPVYESFNNGHALLFSRPGELPYTPVSRRQYLEMKVQQPSNKRAQSMETILKTRIRPKEEQEAEKQKELDKIEKVYAKHPESKWEAARRGYLQGYKTDEQRRDESLKRSNNHYDKEIKKYQDEMNNTSPALLDSPACLGKGKNILGDEKEGGVMFVTVNEGYINQKLPAMVSQFFIMIRTCSEKQIASRYFKNELETKFPFEKLKAMMDQ